jgi:lia operon protein LiaG
VVPPEELQMQRRLTPVLAVIFALILAAPAAAQRNRDRDRDRDRDQDRGPRETETVDRTLTLAPNGTVRLKTFSGRVNITGGSGNQVVIKAVRRATRERLDDIKLEITQNGNVIDIDANHRVVERRNDNVVETDFDIQVPNQVKLDLRTFSAPVTVNNVNGDVEVEGFSSEIRLTDVSGPKRVKTFSGEVHVQARTWTDGDDMNVNTFSGDVELRLPENARGDITFDSFSGTFNSDLPVTLTSSSRRNFRGTLNGGGNTDFRLNTFSGSVRIAR